MIFFFPNRTGENVDYLPKDPRVQMNCNVWSSALTKEMVLITHEVSSENDSNDFEWGTQGQNQDLYKSS